MSDEAARVEYLKETNVHHLFELLASRVLSQRPKEVFSFLRKQLDDIEAEEKKANAPPPAAPTVPPKQQQQQPQGTMKLTLAVFGLDFAGKSALIHAIGGQPNSNTTPTVGFSPTFFETDTADVAMFDLGGGASFRSIWKHYFHDVHGILWVVDGSDEKRLDEARSALNDLISHPYISEKPVLLYINKKDKVDSFLGVDAVVQRLGVANSPMVASKNMKILPVCALDGEDAAIEEGVEWLLQTVKDKFDALSTLVAKHSAEVKEQKKKALEEQAARVAANKAAEEAAAAGKA